MRQKLRMASGGRPLSPVKFGPARAARLLRLLSLSLLVAVSACAPKLGDDCERTAQCSVNLDRTCDLSQPGGYCTVPDCEGNSCPEDGRCVRFQPDEPRLSRAWCMAGCSGSGDCRDQYVCRSAAELNEEASEGRIAEALDSKKGKKFCVVAKD